MKRHIWEFFILAVFASILIFFQFNTIPKNLAYDEVEFSRLALSLQDKPYTSFSDLATGHSTLYFYIILASFKVFGITNIALRLPSAVFGFFGVLAFYLVMRRLFFDFLTLYVTRYTLHIPLLLSLVFVSSHWYLNFARFSFEATFLLFLELSSLYFLLRYLKEKKDFNLIFSGIFAGLAFHSYTPGRIFFLVPLIIILLHTPRRCPALFYFLIPFFIIISPLSLYLATHSDTRIEQQSFFMDKNLSFVQKTQFLGQNIASTALMFNIRGDINGKHNYPLKPALNPVLGILFLAGMFVALKERKKTYHQIFLLYFILSLIPTLLTYPWENPHMLRTFTAIPSVVYFIGIGIMYFIKTLHLRGGRFGIFLLLLILTLSTLYEIRTYFFYQQKVFTQAFEVKGTLPEVLTKTRLQLLMGE